MMTFSLKTLMTSRCPNIYNDLMSMGRLVGGVVEVDDKKAKVILERCNEPIQTVKSPPAKVFDPIPFEKWPIGYKTLALEFSKPEDAGLGDVIERQIGRVGGQQFKEWYKKLFGKDCGCDARKVKLNQQYPMSLVVR